MNKIAILASGQAEATQRLVSLFNEGNRVRVQLIITDEPNSEWAHKISEKGVIVIPFPDFDRPEELSLIDNLLRDNEIKLLALDGWKLPVESQTIEAAGGKIVTLSSIEEAPREVVAVLEEELRRPKVEEAESNKPGERSPEQEWADSLKINFTPPKLPSGPPSIPEDAPTGGNPVQSEKFYKDPVQQIKIEYERSENPYMGQQEYFQQEGIQDGRRARIPSEPMPSTYLIWSILSTILCCVIPGIIAIIYSSQVSSRYFSGDLEGARRASRTAEIWIIVSVVLGVLSATLYMPLMFLFS